MPKVTLSAQCHQHKRAMRVELLEDRCVLSAVSFAAHDVVTHDTIKPWAVSSADLDGDGNADVLSASTNKIAWYQNSDGLGTFGPQRVISRIVGTPLALFAADIDGDGDDDVLSASRNRLEWHANRDAGNVWTHHTIETAAASLFIGFSSVFAADLDRDGDADVITSSFDGDFVAWYENTDGQGTFGLQRTISVLAETA